MSAAGPDPPPPAGAAPGGRRPLSLALRLTLAASAVLAAFLGLTGWALDKAFRSSALEASRERLEARVYMLLGAAELEGDGSLAMPEALPEPRLSAPGSGAYAAVAAANGETLWHSPSALGIDVDYPPARLSGGPAFGQVPGGAEGPVLALSYPVSWELPGSPERVVVFQAAESRAALDAQVSAFRRTLLVWLGTAAVVLLAGQAAVLVWSLAPLRRVAREVGEIEAGHREALTGRYPRELRPLTDSLNALIRSSQTRLRRYRDSMADLAHSLKTPLAVLRAATGEDLPPGVGESVREQVDRMDQTIAYQLQRAAASGRTVLAGSVAVAPVARRLAASLDKVYRDKALALELDIGEDVRFAGDAGDLTEILGNLADNACKWARRRVRIEATNPRRDASGRPLLRLAVEDDGPGIPDDLRREVLERGVRADSLVPGQGIGLAVVREMVVEIYGGELAIERGDLGGARLVVGV